MELEDSAGRIRPTGARLGRTGTEESAEHKELGDTERERQMATGKQ
jgi:hypothetical protein